MEFATKKKLYTCMNLSQTIQFALNIFPVLNTMSKGTSKIQATDCIFLKDSYNHIVACYFIREF